MKILEAEKHIIRVVIKIIIFMINILGRLCPLKIDNLAIIIIADTHIVSKISVDDMVSFNE